VVESTYRVGGLAGLGRSRSLGFNVKTVVRGLTAPARKFKKMLDRDTKNRIIDYFDPWDLVEFLGVKTEDIVEAFEVEVEDLLDDIEELMGVTDDD
jgi:hypothetical protein